MELMFSGINYWAVLVGAAATMVTGMLWYSPSSPTGSMWMRLNNFTNDGGGDDMGKLYFLQFLSSLVLSFFLAVMVKTLNITDYNVGLMVGFWLWVGFIDATCAGQYIFPPKPFQLFALDNIYKLINVLIIVAIVIAWK